MSYMSNHCKPNTKEYDLTNNTIDSDLINAWGIVVDDYIWVVANGTDLLIRYTLTGADSYDISFYNEAGVLLSNPTNPVVNPTGIIKNPTNGYFVTDGTSTLRSTYLIASESGDIFGYNKSVGGGN